MGLFRAAEHTRALSLSDWPQLKNNYFELARLWVSDEQSFVIVSPGHLESPALLGSLFAECLRTAADAFAATGNFTPDNALRELWKGFDEERQRIFGELGAGDADGEA
jgi:Domain of unknown function (DUF5076)